MADLFSVTAPLTIRCPSGSPKVMLERFRHPDGLLFFELYWERLDGTRRVHLIEGEVRGEGPWKVGDCVVTVLGCHGGQPEMAGDFAQWQMEIEQGLAAYPPRAEIVRLARERGALVD
jgi:hypothetical protein